VDSSGAGGMGGVGWAGLGWAQTVGRVIEPQDQQGAGLVSEGKQTGS